jgi:hypothetical protein
MAPPQIACDVLLTEQSSCSRTRKTHAHQRRRMRYRIPGSTRRRAANGRRCEYTLTSDFAIGKRAYSKVDGTSGQNVQKLVHNRRSPDQIRGSSGGLHAPSPSTFAVDRKHSVGSLHTPTANCIPEYPGNASSPQSITILLSGAKSPGDRTVCGRLPRHSSHTIKVYAASSSITRVGTTLCPCGHYITLHTYVEMHAFSSVSTAF